MEEWGLATYENTKHLDECRAAERAKARKRRTAPEKPVRPPRKSRECVHEHTRTEKGRGTKKGTVVICKDCDTAIMWVPF